MKQFFCGDVVPGCEARFVAEDEDGILTQVAEHAKSDHGMTQIPSSLPAAVIAHIQDVNA
jgi:predicted small metal-binding protein